MTTTTRVTALVAGSAVIGAGLGLLLAPQSGADTRRDLRRYAKRAQVQATRMSRSIKAGFERAVDYSAEHELIPDNVRPIGAA